MLLLHHIAKRQMLTVKSSQKFFFSRGAVSSVESQELASPFSTNALGEDYLRRYYVS